MNRDSTKIAHANFCHVRNHLRALKLRAGIPQRSRKRYEAVKGGQAWLDGLRRSPDEVERVL
jgi:hypothetical protein